MTNTNEGTTFIDPWFSIPHSELSRAHSSLAGRPLRRRSIARNENNHPPAFDDKTAASQSNAVPTAPKTVPTALTSTAMPFEKNHSASNHALPAVALPEARVTAAEARMAELAAFKARKAAEKALKSSNPPSSKRSK